MEYDNFRTFFLREMRDTLVQIFYSRDEGQKAIFVIPKSFIRVEGSITLVCEPVDAFEKGHRMLVPFRQVLEEGEVHLRGEVGWE